MHVKKRILSISLILFTSILMGFYLMVLCYGLPTDGIRKNVAKTVHVYRMEGNSFQFAPGYQNTQLCGYTGSIMLSEAMYERGKDVEEIIQNAILVPRYAQGEGGPAPQLLRALKAKPGEKINRENYARYWHGYLILLKPLLLVFTLSDIRILNMYIQTTLFFILIFSLYRKGGKKLSIPFFLVVFFLNPITCALSLHMMTIYYIMLISCLLLLKQKIYNSDKYFEFFLSIGIVTVFFDNLTYPLISLGIPLTLFILLNKENTKDKIKKVALSSLAWFIGYAGMWIGKLVLGSIIIKENILLNAYYSAKYRMGAPEHTIVKAIYSSISAYNNRVMYLLALVMVFVMLFFIFYKKYRIKLKLSIIIPLTLISSYPFIWCAVLKQHSIAHTHYACRIFTITILALVYGIIFSLKKREKKKTVNKAFEQTNDRC